MHRILFYGNTTTERALTQIYLQTFLSLVLLRVILHALKPNVYFVVPSTEGLNLYFRKF